MKTNDKNDVPAYTQLTLFGMDEYISQHPIVRPDRNLGILATRIFTSPWAPDVAKIREYHWTKIEDDGQVKDESLIVTPALERKTPTTTTYKYFLGLTYLWEQQGMPENGEVIFSARTLAKTCKIKWGGTNTCNAIFEHLEILSGVNLKFVESYKRKNSAVEEEYTSTEIKILVSNSMKRRSEAKTPRDEFSQLHKVRFHHEVVAQMMLDNVRPIRFETVRTIGNEGAISLYTQIDLTLSEHPVFSRRLEPFFREDLKRDSDRYKYKSVRKAKAIEFVKAIDGKRLTNGSVLSLSVEETSDGEDYKFVGKPIGKKSRIKSQHIKPICDEDTADYLANDLAQMILRHDKSGKPNVKYIAHLARYIPERIMRDALGIATKDYQGKVKSSLSALFIGVLKQMAKDCNIDYPKPNP